MVGKLLKSIVRDGIVEQLERQNVIKQSQQSFRILEDAALV